MHHSSSSASRETSTAAPATSPHSISEIVFDPDSYSALQNVSKATDTAHHEPSKQSSAPTTASSSNNSASSPTAEGHHHSTNSNSLADLVLNNVTYDAILSSSTKGLDVSSHTQPAPPHSPAFPDDVRTPPNSPVVSGSGGNTLMSTLMSSADPVSTGGDERVNKDA